MEKRRYRSYEETPYSNQADERQDEYKQMADEIIWEAESHGHGFLGASNE